MAESTARRERGEPISAPLSTYLWEVPQKPVAVRLAFDCIDRLENEVIENFRSLTSQGSEIGGVLLGAVIPGSPATVIVQDYESIQCDYSRGPLYRLSDADLGRFERAIEQHSAPGAIPVAGFFRAHSRKGLSLDADDLSFLDVRFRGANHIALLVRPFATKTSVGGLFIREDGVFHGDASYLEFPFRSSQLTPSLWTPPAAAPPPPPPMAAAPSVPPVVKPTIRPQVVPIGLRRDSAVSAPPPEVKPPAPPVDRMERRAPEIKPPVPAPEMKAAAPVRPAPPEPKPAPKEVKLPPPMAKVPPPSPVVEPKAAPAAKAATEKPPVERPVFGSLSGAAPVEESSGGKLPLVIGGIAVLLAALVVLFVYPGYLTHTQNATTVGSAAAELTLRVEPSGTDLLLTWNKNSAAIVNASHGVLSINDGERHENYDMDSNQLKTGSIVYTPVTGDVSFNMEVTGTDQRKTTTESVRSLRTRPSPMPDGKVPATSPTQAKAIQPASQNTEPAANTQPASTTPEAVTPAAPAKAAPKVFNAASLKDRLRPASPTEIAALDAAPASPAGVNVNSNLSGIQFGSAPAPMAPAPPAAAKKAAVSGGKVAPAQLVYRKEPEYPTAARQLGAHGTVVLDATIARDGKVIGVKVISGHPLLVQAAKAAVMQWRYRPTLLDGQPVENTDRISLNFVSAH
ncbi:MAG: energy transducer TonB [Bryobacteraceae bacterium]